MFLTRVLTAAVLIGVIAAALWWWPAWTFDGLVLLTTVLALAEFYRLTLTRTRYYRVIALGAGVVVAIAQLWPQPWLPLPALLCGLLFLVTVLFMWRLPTLEPFAPRVGIVISGIVYLALTLPYLSWLRRADHGPALVSLLILMVACSDTAAYLVGRSCGRHRLAPLISPKKTWEGAIAGIAGSVLGFVIGRTAFWPGLPWGSGVGLALAISVVAPLGDLVESAIKRGVHVKDSSQLLPGHGGVLDRIDAYLFTAPLVYYFAGWFWR